MSSDILKVCCIGDVVARDGRTALHRSLGQLRSEHNFDLLLVNAENAAGGSGLTPKIAEEMQGWGVDFITLGDHTWQHRELRPYLDKHADYCIRPDNYPLGAAGRGWLIKELDNGLLVGVMNLIGRVFMTANVDCPFRRADMLLANELKQCNIIVCDFHAEATSEKIAMGYHLDGRVSLLFGTHTHVQTADEKILAKGTGYISDIGMTGSQNGVIGMDSRVALQRFLSALPSSYKPAKGAAEVCGLCAHIDTKTGKTVHLERIQIKDQAAVT